MRRTLVPVVLVALLVLSAAPSFAQSRRVGALVGPVRLVPKAGSTLRVAGLHDYYGRIELRAAGDGLVVVNRLPLEEYLLGLNEVPTRWPTAALEAQAIAARTYALWTLDRPRAGAAATYGFDICASVQCQVFAGADVIQQASMGERWRAAVDSTRGQAVLHAGEPILARYHSTSGGRTFDNEQIFPSEGSFPYLKGVVSTTEEASPLYRWHVRFTIRRLQKIVRRAGLLPTSAGRLREVRTVESTTGRHYPDVLLVGRNGRARITAEELRVNVRVLAPDLFPNLYPSFAPTSSGRLPEVFPSNRLTITTEGKNVQVVGRGWGHGVGMSQWGAEGLAREGAGPEEILKHYYTGVEIGEVASDEPIDVGVAWGRDKVTVSGDMKIVDGRSKTIVGNALGSWVFTETGSGAVNVRPPKGFGLPLRIGIVEAPSSAVVGSKVRVTVALSRPARVKAATEGERRGRGRVRSAGTRKVAWRAPEVPGTYVVEIAAHDGNRRRADTMTISVVEEPQPGRAGEAEDVAAGEGGGRPLVPALIASFLLISCALGLRKVTMGR